MRFYALRPIAAVVTAIEGAVVAALAIWVLLMASPFGSLDAAAVDTQVPLAFVGAAVAAVILRGARILGRPNATLSTARRLLLAVVGIMQLALAGPLLWFTLTDPLEARVNIMLTVVSLLFVMVALAISPLVRWGARP